MKETAVGFIGFGEAAYHIAKGLISEGIKSVYSYDINMNHPSNGSIIKDRANDANVTLLQYLKELFENCNIIICSTSAKFAVPVAQESVNYLKEGHLYVDINASSPMAMQEISSILEKTHGKFVDAAVMESVPQHKHKVPILLCGNGAMEFYEFGEKYGMNLSVINGQAGSASAIKMIRSVFMKGFTMLMLETLSASHKLNVEDYMMNSISRTLESPALTKITNHLITRTVVHAERRVSEMEEVIQTLKQNDIDSIMSVATKTKLETLVEMNLKSYFNYHIPKNYMDIVSALREWEEK